MLFFIVETEKDDIRSKIIGLIRDNTDLWNWREFNKKESCYEIPYEKAGFSPYNIMDAIEEGWKLLGPPYRYGANELWTWWLTKEE